MSVCSNYLTEIEQAYDAAKYWWNLGDIKRDWLVANSTWGTFNQTWRDNIIAAIARLYSTVEFLIWGSDPIAEPLKLPYYLRNCVGAGEIDMAAILTAMSKAKFDELQTFIGIEDAYRVALWNAPFNADFYAALARGFQKWP